MNTTARPTGGPRLLSAQAAAEYTGWPYTTIRDMAVRGQLPVVRIPGQRRMWFCRTDLDRAIDAWRERAGR
jgi:excisionase family DNA binding protein